MEPADYDAWYRTPKGAWIGEQEFRLLRAMLGPRPGETLLDVGCGTGYFTRWFAADGKCRVIGLDIDCSWAGYAASQSAGNEAYVCGTAIELPFRNGTFDLSVSVAAPLRSPWSRCYLRGGRLHRLLPSPGTWSRNSTDNGAPTGRRCV